MSAKPDAQIDTELKGVEQLVRSASEGEPDHYAGKRHNTRICESIPLEMTEALGRKPIAVTMHNISRTGCAFWLKRKLEIHAPVYIREFTPDNTALWIPGYVTHCTQGILGYLVGIAFGRQR